jgi:hypothetical protein
MAGSRKGGRAHQWANRFNDSGGSWLVDAAVAIVEGRAEAGANLIEQPSEGVMARKAMSSGKRGKGTQPESAVLSEQKPRKIASLRVGGAQRSAEQRNQKKRDSRQQRSR